MQDESKQLDCKKRNRDHSSKNVWNDIWTGHCGVHSGWMFPSAVCSVERPSLTAWTSNVQASKESFRMNNRCRDEHRRRYYNTHDLHQSKVGDATMFRSQTRPIKSWSTCICWEDISHTSIFGMFRFGHSITKWTSLSIDRRPPNCIIYSILIIIFFY